MLIEAERFINPRHSDGKKKAKRKSNFRSASRGENIMNHKQLITEESYLITVTLTA